MVPGSRTAVAWPSHVVRRLAREAALVPLLIVGVGVLGTSLDWFPAALILAVLTVALAIAVLVATATKGGVLRRADHRTSRRAAPGCSSRPR